MVEKQIKGDKAIVSFEKEFTVQEVKELKTIFRQLEDDGIVKLLFDMSTIKYIDSSAIGMLVTMLKYAKKNDGYLKLYSPTDELKRILKLVNLFSFFEITDTL